MDSLAFAKTSPLVPHISKTHLNIYDVERQRQGRQIEIARVRSLLQAMSPYYLLLQTDAHFFSFVKRDTHTFTHTLTHTHTHTHTRTHARTFAHTHTHTCVLVYGMLSKHYQLVNEASPDGHYGCCTTNLQLINLMALTGYYGFCGSLTLHILDLTVNGLLNRFHIVIQTMFHQLPDPSSIS